MAEKSKITNFAENFLGRIKSMDGRVVGKDLQSSKFRLAKDPKGAMVNDIVDKYLRKELTNEYLRQVKKEYGITSRDITKEIAKREIQKVLGR